MKKEEKLSPIEKQTQNLLYFPHKHKTMSTSTKRTINQVDSPVEQPKIKHMKMPLANEGNYEDYAEVMVWQAIKWFRTEGKKIYTDCQDEEFVDKLIGKANKLAGKRIVETWEEFLKKYRSQYNKVMAHAILLGLQGINREDNSQDQLPDEPTDGEILGAYMSDSINYCITEVYNECTLQVQNDQGGDEMPALEHLQDYLHNNPQYLHSVCRTIYNAFKVKA